MLPNIGDGALGALETITGGHAGPSSAGSNANQGFSVGEFNMGSPKNTINPMVALALAAMVIAGVWLYAKK